MDMKVVFAAMAAGALLLATGMPAQTVRTIVIHAKRYAFVPDEITLKRGEPVNLEVISDDVAHSLRIDGLNVNIKVMGGETAKFEVTPEANGDFPGKCGVFCGGGHGKMLFTVHVVGGNK
jgi:cytochrome c oxidase subunit 2